MKHSYWPSAAENGERGTNCCEADTSSRRWMDTAIQTAHRTITAWRYVLISISRLCIRTLCLTYAGMLVARQVEGYSQQIDGFTATITSKMFSVKGNLLPGGTDSAWIWRIYYSLKRMQVMWSWDETQGWMNSLTVETMYGLRRYMAMSEHLPGWHNRLNAE